MAARQKRANPGDALDRFLIRAIIGLASLMIGVLLGFSLAVFYPKPPVVAEAPPPECDPTPANAESPVAEPVQPQPVAEPPTEGEDPGEAEGSGELEGPGEVEGAGDAQADAEPPSEPAPTGEPIPISGNLIIEVRDITEDVRRKTDIRATAKRGAHQLEACIAKHAPELEQFRIHHQLHVAPSGKVAGKLLIGGSNPELDACVGEAIEGWNFGAADASSFFKLKLVWMA